MNTPKRTNSMVDWDAFNAETYRKHYFINPPKEDMWIPERGLAFFARQGTKAGSIKLAADIGTGPSLILPLMSCVYAQNIELIEFGSQNVAYLQSVTADQALMKRDWAHIQNIIANYPHALPEHHRSADLLRARSRVRHMDGRDLEPNTYDLITYTFWAESVTNDLDECALLIDASLRALKPGGLFIAAYVKGSKQGYPDYDPEGLKKGKLDMKRFPAADIDDAWLKKRFAGTNITIEQCPYAREYHDDYDGVLVATGTK